MAQAFKETAHLNTDLKAYADNYDHIFNCKDCGLKKKDCECDQTTAESDKPNQSNSQPHLS